MNKVAVTPSVHTPTCVWTISATGSGAGIVTGTACVLRACYGDTSDIFIVSMSLPFNGVEAFYFLQRTFKSFCDLFLFFILFFIFVQDVFLCLFDGFSLVRSKENSSRVFSNIEP